MYSVVLFIFVCCCRLGPSFQLGLGFGPCPKAQELVRDGKKSWQIRSFHANGRRLFFENFPAKKNWKIKTPFRRVLRRNLHFFRRDYVFWFIRVLLWIFASFRYLRYLRLQPTLTPHNAALPARDKTIQFIEIFAPETFYRVV